MSRLPSSGGEIRQVNGPTKRAAAFLVGAAAILGSLAYLRVLTKGELHDKYVYGDMGPLIATPMEHFVPFKSPSGYLFYAVPTRTRGNAVKGDPDEFVQLIALGTLCSGEEVCLWDRDKQIDASCSNVEASLRDPRVLEPVKNYLRSKCRRG